MKTSKRKRLLVKGARSGEYVELPEPAPVVVRFKKLHPEAKIPTYESAQASGCDLSSTEDVTFLDGQVLTIATGLAIELPEGYEAQVRPRSGLSIKGLTIANAPGSIDRDFRGEVKVIARWFKPAGTVMDYFTLAKGSRVAQLIIAPVVQAVLEEVAELSETARGEKGFGSSGI